ncbi:neither inactivation nor afterpotential protein G-like isoform X2 [Leptopilina boulardi]|uniref:neither inactivation nor afterpotential protein G-like isoform X2 n=1 Tax=Leptopilina boulardi TaxID=63433 RepID=UPI0021F67E5E|nr:neither inactivation nor afterpotential protein G-like isoform X2 [Leptopilina boulardi]
MQKQNKMWSYVLFSLVILSISLICHRIYNEPISLIDKPNESYDYIIGAGTAGCVLASRLSENANSTVLLVEAGGQFNWFSTVPLAAPVLFNSHVDWAFKTEPQWYSSKGLHDHRQKWPRGKGLGGSGQLNFLAHSFGKAEDFTKWPGGWSFFDLQPYFKKVSAIMNVRKISSDDELANAVIGAGEKFKKEGANFIPASDTLNDGSRWSSFNAYLQRAWNRENLHILTNTLVTKIVMGTNSKIEGIEIKYENGSRGKVIAKNEVILSGGTINSPQLLMVSGIGPSMELKKHNITIVKEILGVGQNLFDHLNMPLYVFLEAPFTITIKKIQSISTLLQYFIFGTGLLTTNGIKAVGRKNNSGFMIFAGASTDEKLLKDIGNYRTEVFRSLYPTYNNTSQEGLLMLTSCYQPKSRGNITLKSDNILDPPAIDPSYLEHDDDIKCSQEGVKLALKIVESEEFRKLGAKLHVPNLKNCPPSNNNYWDDNFSECVIRIGGIASYHPGGTCKMGTGSDAVVDTKLRVKGIKGLRIVDGSVFPSPISGHPNSVIIALAERAADFIIDKRN